MGGRYAFNWNDFAPEKMAEVVRNGLASFSPETDGAAEYEYSRIDSKPPAARTAFPRRFQTAGRLYRILSPNPVGSGFRDFCSLPDWPPPPQRPPQYSRFPVGSGFCVFCSLPDGGAKDLGLSGDESGKLFKASTIRCGSQWAVEDIDSRSVLLEMVWREPSAP